MVTRPSAVMSIFDIKKKNDKTHSSSKTRIAPMVILSLDSTSGSIVSECRLGKWS